MNIKLKAALKLAMILLIAGLGATATYFALTILSKGTIFVILGVACGVVVIYNMYKIILGIEEMKQSRR